MKKLVKVFNLILWIGLSAIIFYRGSINVGIWGKWQGFEIVMPLIITMVLSGIIVLIVFLFEHLLGL